MNQDYENIYVPKYYVKCIKDISSKKTMFVIYYTGSFTDEIIDNKTMMFTAVYSGHF